MFKLKDKHCYVYDDKTSLVYSNDKGSIFIKNDLMACTTSKLCILVL